MFEIGILLPRVSHEHWLNYYARYLTHSKISVMNVFFSLFLPLEWDKAIFLFLSKWISLLTPIPSFILTLLGSPLSNICLPTSTLLSNDLLPQSKIIHMSSYLKQKQFFSNPAISDIPSKGTTLLHFCKKFHKSSSQYIMLPFPSHFIVPSCL